MSGKTTIAMVGAAMTMITARAALGQSRGNSPAFEVASVKPNRSGTMGSSISRSGGRITLENVSLRESIAFAYGIATGRDYELVGPAWLDSEKFDMIATFPPETSRDRVREMLQKLLAERFSLKTHRESRKVRSYALLVAKSAKANDKSRSLAALGMTSHLRPAAAGDDGAFIFGEGRVTARAISMPSLADRLSGPVFKLERPVVDMTGINGAYDFTLEWAPDGVAADGRPSIFTALQEQLGLRLEARETTVGILVVDRADRIPAGN